MRLERGVVAQDEARGTGGVGLWRPGSQAQEAGFGASAEGSL